MQVMHFVVPSNSADAVFQRYLGHQERNLKAKLSNDIGVSRLFTRLRTVQGFDAAKEVIDELNKFIKPIK